MLHLDYQWSVKVKTSGLTTGWTTSTTNYNFRFALDVSVYITGYDFKSRIIRRTLVRYVNLASILCFRDICVPIRKRFPSLDHLINAGMLIA